MANVATLTVKVVSDVKDAQKGLSGVGDSAGGFKSKLATASKVATASLLGIGAAAISAGKAAAEDAQSQAVLANAMRNNAGASQAQIAATEEQISKMSAASGVADDQLRPAMGNLVRATGDATKSQDALQVALDVAAATGQDVETVSKAMAKGYGGNTKALGKLVPGMDKAVLASGDMNKVMAELAKTTGGASAAAADTAAGRMQRMQVAMNEAQESIGAALLPAMSGLATILMQVANAAAAHPGLFKAIAVVIAIVAAAILVLNVATTVYTSVTTIAGAVSGAAWAAALWPILLVIAAIAAVVVVVILLWKKCETFRAVVLAVWSAIRAATSAVVGWLKSAWSAVFAAASAYVKAYLTVIRFVFNAIRAAAGAVVGWLKTAWAVTWALLKAGANSVTAPIRAAFNAVRAAAGTVASAIQSQWSRVWSALRSAAAGLGAVLSAPFHAVQSAISAVIGAVQSLISALGRIRVPKISLPKIPGLSAAATATGTRANLARSPVQLGNRASSSSAGAVVININGAIDPEATARQVQRLLNRHTQRVGRTGALKVS